MPTLDQALQTIAEHRLLVHDGADAWTPEIFRCFIETYVGADALDAPVTLDLDLARQRGAVYHGLAAPWMVVSRSELPEFS